MGSAGILIFLNRLGLYVVHLVILTPEIYSMHWHSLDLHYRFIYFGSYPSGSDPAPFP